MESVDPDLARVAYLMIVQRGNHDRYRCLCSTFREKAVSVVWDRRTGGKVHPATWTGFIACALTAAVPLVLMATGSWAPIAERLPGVGS